ncbi:MAG: peroxiredoxin family protein [Planctomycetota bacterium]|jgi:peroxiredoxin
MRLGNILVVVLALGLTAPSLGQREGLSVGDPSPGLDIAAWIEGEALSIESGRVYVVLFWESASGTGQVGAKTLKTLTHLRELAEQYKGKGLVVLAISSEEEDRLRQFVVHQRQGLGFAVAADRRNATERAWVQAAGLSARPAAFIVGRDGRIMHIGDALADEFDGILESVIRGRYDPRLIEQAEPMLKAARRSRTVKNWRMATKHYNEVIALDGRVFAEVALERFEMIILDMEEPQQAYAYARNELVDQLFRDDAEALRLLASRITLDPRITKPADRDLELAQEAASKAVEIAGREDPAALSTLALVHFHRGDVETAIELQTQAYFIARPSDKAGYKRVLKGYQEAAARASTSATRKR